MWRRSETAGHILPKNVFSIEIKRSEQTEGLHFSCLPKKIGVLVLHDQILEKVVLNYNVFSVMRVSKSETACIMRMYQI